MKEINVVQGTDGTFIIRLLSEDGITVLETAQTFDVLVDKLKNLTASATPKSVPQPASASVN